MVTLAAFPTVEEAEMIALMRTDPDVWVEGLSQVATNSEGEVIAHCLLTRCTIGDTPALIMGPVSVLPHLQNQGAGTAVVTVCLEKAKELQESFVVLVGHPNYYPRFGFIQADTYGITITIDCPREAIMALSLNSDPLPSGVIHARFHGLT